jgi:hypothetical protein
MFCDFICDLFNGNKFQQVAKMLMAIDVEEWATSSGEFWREKSLTNGGVGWGDASANTVWSIKLFLRTPWEPKKLDSKCLLEWAESSAYSCLYLISTFLQ